MARASRTSHGYGAGILQFIRIGWATLEIEDSTLTASWTAIGQRGKRESEVSGNVYTGGGPPTSPPTNGGGVFAGSLGAGSSSVALIEGSTITNNFATNGGGGIFNFSDQGSSSQLTVTGSMISNNTAAAGGGIFGDAENGGSSWVSLMGSTVSGNSASLVGGGILVNQIGTGSSSTLIIDDASFVTQNWPTDCVALGGAAFP
jgi:hypothetical protein